jgi:predicted Na+-dependent transporter
MIVRSLAWMERRSAILLAGGVFVGLISQDLAALCKPLVSVSVFLLLTATILRLDWSQVMRRLRAPLLPLAIVAALMVGAPLLISSLLGPLHVPAFLHTPVVLLASSPPLIAVPAYALLLGLDGPLALVILVAGSLLQPFIQPPVALALAGVKVEVGIVPLMIRLALFVGGSFVLGAVLRAVAGRERIVRHGPTLGGIAVFMLLVFAVGIMDGVRGVILADPLHALACIAAVFALSFGLQAAGILVFWAAAPVWRISGQEALTASMVAGTRNLATLVAVLGNSASPDVYLVLAVNQFPMYLLPSLCGPVYRKLLRLRA